MNIPANTIYRPNVGPLLGQRRRRWTNTGPTLARCIVFAWIWLTYITHVTLALEGGSCYCTKRQLPPFATKVAIVLKGHAHAKIIKNR